MALTVLYSSAALTTLTPKICDMDADPVVLQPAWILGALEMRDHREQRREEQASMTARAATVCITLRVQYSKASDLTSNERSPLRRVAISSPRPTDGHQSEAHALALDEESAVYRNHSTGATTERVHRSIERARDPLPICDGRRDHTNATNELRW